VGDVDRDGSLDVVAGFSADLSMGESPEPVRVYFNDGEGFFGPGDLLGDTPYSTLGLALGDMDGDGQLDVIESSQYDPTADVRPPLRVRLGVGDGSFGGAQAQPGSPVFGYDLTVADLNGDGALDVLSAGGNDLSVGNGDGTLAEGAPFAPGVDYVYALAVGDLDGDGAVDVVLSRYNQPNQIHMNTNSSGYAYRNAQNPLALVTDGPLATPIFIDWDSDGDADLFVGNDSGTFRYYRNDGTPQVASFVTATSPLSAVSVGGNADGTFFDWDGDGDEDFFAGAMKGGFNFYLNSGGSFAQDPLTDLPQLSAASAYNVSAPRFVDLDDDGDEDVVIGYDDGVTGYLAYYRNDFGVYTEVPSVENPFDGLTSGLLTHVRPALEDTDFDGDFDIFIGDESGIVRFLENTGQPTSPQFTDGVFNSLGMVKLTGGNSAPVLVDIDGDGDRDAFIGDGYGAVHFYEFLSTDTGVGPIVETTSALGLNQVAQLAPGYEVVVFSIGVAGDDVATLSHIELQIEGVSQPTVALSPTDLQAANLYVSNDDVLDAADVLIGSTMPVPGSLTVIGPANAEVISSTESFYIATVVIDTGATEGAAFRVGFQSNGFVTTANSVGTEILSNDGDRVEISTSDTGGPGGTYAVAEAWPAAGLNQVAQHAPGDEVPIFTIGIEGDGAAIFAQLDLEIGDLAGSPTGLLGTDLSAIYLYRSADAVWDAADSLIGDNAGLLTPGGTTSLTAFSPEVLSAQPTYYIATAEIDSFAFGGSAFRLGFPSGGFKTSAENVGTEVLANDADRIEILSVGPPPGPPNAMVFLPGPFEVADSLVVEFDRPVYGWGPESLVASGSQSGYIDGFHAGEGTSFVRFEEFDPAFPGETVFATLTTAVYSETGESLESGYVWSFTRPAGPGPAIFDVAVAGLTSMVADTRALPVGDVDGDGDLDVVAGNYDEPSVVFLNDGNGLHWDGLLADEIVPVQAMLLGDLNGDGYLDGFVGLDSQPHQVLENVLQDTSLAEPMLWDVAGELPNSGDTRGLALGDLDGDGLLDVVAANSNESNAIYFNAGDLVFDSPVGLGDAFDVTYDVAFADMDNDGDLDVMTAENGSANRLFDNDGSGLFTPEGTVVDLGAGVGEESAQTYAIRFADFDQDGDQDVLMANFNMPNTLFRSWENTWNSLGSATQETARLAIGDLDGDGYPDIVAGNYNDVNRFYLYDPVEPGGFLSDDVAPEVDNTWALSLGDLDGDGDLDIVTTATSDTNEPINRIFFNADMRLPPELVDVTPLPWTTSVPEDQGPSAEFSEPLLGAGELVVVGSQSGAMSGVVSGEGTEVRSVDLDESFFPGETVRFTILPHMESAENGQLLYSGGTFEYSVAAGPGPAIFDRNLLTIGSEVRDTEAIAVADINGDGKLDVVTGNVGSGNRVYLGLGTGAFQSTVGLLDADTETAPTRALVVADLSGDGFLDAVSVRDGQSAHFYEGDGQGGFSSETVLTGLVRDTRALAVGDVDGDGDIDLVEGNDSSPHRLIINDGQGSFEPEVDLSVSPRTTRALMLADLDLDGQLDLLEGNDVDPNRILWNSGIGDGLTYLFDYDEELGAAAGATRALAVGDLNEDGWPDVVVGRKDGQDAAYFGSDDPGNIVETPLGAATSPTSALVLGDLDGDGDLDVVRGLYGEISQRHLNDGAGSFDTGAEVDDVINNTTSLALGDLDGDGDLDVAEGIEAKRNRLHLNSDVVNATQLVFTTQPGSAQYKTPFTAPPRVTAQNLNGVTAASLTGLNVELTASSGALSNGTAAMTAG
ncbi:MAG: VCBS repeat-containing protein, partial [Candidatus Latescibacterota bacterium]|nr:VCBS repeat-containing protein [Candidatus Latescibacterota bacterium]